MIFNSNAEKFLFYSFPIFLFSLIPFFFFTCPFLSDLAVSVISLLFLIYCIKQKNFSFFKKKYFYIFLAFWLYLIINNLINNFNLDSLKISLFYFRYGVFVIAVVALLSVDDKFIKYFFFCILICFLSLILDGFYQYFNGENILGWKSQVRISSFFGEEKILGSYLSRLWPIFFGLSIYFYKPRDKMFILFIFIFILSEALIFLSGDRTAFFNINLSAIFVILLSQKLIKLRLITLLTTIFLLVIINFFNPTSKEIIFDQTIKQMKGIEERVEGEVGLIRINEDDEGIFIFTKTHTHHYITAYKMYLENKFLGVGVRNFRNLCSDKKYEISELSCSSHPHNTYIQILSETGIIGFLFLLLALSYFCIYVLKHLILKIRGNYYFNDFEICILSGIAIYLWPVIPTGNAFSNWLSIIMILNFPFLIWSRKFV